MTTQIDAKGLAETYKSNKKDTGNPSFQIAVLTDNINNLTQHLTGNKKDHASLLGLMKMVGKRKRLLSYLGRVDQQQYQKVISELNIRK